MTDTPPRDPDPVRAVRFETVDRIAVLTFDEPEKLNPMSAAMVEQSLEAIERVALDDRIRVLVVTGAGRAFSAGGDVRTLGDHDDGPGRGRGGGAGPGPFQRRAWLRRTQRLILALHQLEKPTIAAINGVAAGGGCDIALACDIRFMATEARIGEIFANIGLFPGTGGTWFLPRIVGPEKALELIWTGELIDGPEAGRIGLVGHVVPGESLMDSALAFARRLAEGPPLAQALAKAAVHQGADQDLATALDYASTAEAITLTSDDHREGIRAFRAKRRPVFEGR